MKKENGTMQVIIFDRYFQCIYRLHNIPEEWDFKQVAKALELTRDVKDYNAFRLMESAPLCIDDYNYDGKELKLIASNCED